jgi:hypothetical protein
LGFGSVLDFGFWIFGFRVLDFGFGFWSLAFDFWSLDFATWELGVNWELWNWDLGVE